MKSNLYRSENLTLFKLLEVSQYDKDALILVRVDLAVKQITSQMEFQGRCGIVTKSGTWLRTVGALMTMFTSPVEDWAILLFVADTNKNMPTTQPAPPVMGEPLCKPGEGEKRESACCHKQSDGEESEDDALCLFTASTSEGLKTLELHINDEIINVTVDSGASCNHVRVCVLFSNKGEGTLSRV